MSGESSSELAHLLHQRFERDLAAVRRRLLRAAVGQRRLAERDGALERAHQLRREALHLLVLRAREPVGEQLRGREQVAQVVVDLRHREAQRREPGLLLQQCSELALHIGKLALGGADLVLPAGGGDDARGIFRIGAEPHHVGGDPVQRPHEQIVQRQVDQRRGDRGNDQRQQEDVRRELQHRRAQRLLVHDDLDELAAARRIAEHADDLVVGRQQDRKGMHDGAVPGRVAYVDFVIDRRRHVADHEQAALAAHLHGDGARADRVEHLPGQMIGHVRCRLQHQRGGVGVGELVPEPIQSVVRDRRHIDQHFRDHHEQDREHEELVGQAELGGEPLLQAGAVLHLGLVGRLLSMLKSRTVYQLELALSFRSFPRKRESSLDPDWVPAYAGTNGPTSPPF